MRVAVDRPFPFIGAPFRSVLYFFIAIDILFILIHAGAWATFRLGLTGDVPYMLRISEDRSLPEIFNYVKWTIIVVGLTKVGLRDRWLVPLGWAAVFLLLLLDDSLQFHESFGILIADRFQIPDDAYLEAADVGELIYALVMGGLVAVLAGTALLNSGRSARHLSVTYILVIIGFGFFSVIVDALHRAVINSFPGNGLLQDFAALVEEGGEMFVASAAAAATLAPLTWARLWKVAPEGSVGPSDGHARP